MYCHKAWGCWRSHPHPDPALQRSNNRHTPIDHKCYVNLAAAGLLSSMGFCGGPVICHLVANNLGGGEKALSSAEVVPRAQCSFRFLPRDHLQPGLLFLCLQQGAGSVLAAARWWAALHSWEPAPLDAHTLAGNWTLLLAAQQSRGSGCWAGCRRGCHTQWQQEQQPCTGPAALRSSMERAVPQSAGRRVLRRLWVLTASRNLTHTVQQDNTLACMQKVRAHPQHESGGRRRELAASLLQCHCNNQSIYPSGDRRSLRNVVSRSRAVDDGCRWRGFQEARSDDKTHAANLPAAAQPVECSFLQCLGDHMQLGVLQAFVGLLCSWCARPVAGRRWWRQRSAARCSPGWDRVMQGFHIGPVLHCSARQVQGWSAGFRTRQHPRSAQCHTQQPSAAVEAVVPCRWAPAGHLHSLRLVGHSRKKLPLPLAEQRTLLCRSPVVGPPASAQCGNHKHFQVRCKAQVLNYISMTQNI